jgi:hypothetical protein
VSGSPVAVTWGSHRGRARRCCRRPAGSWLPRAAPGLLGDPGGRVRPHQLCASGNRPGAAWVKVIADFPDLAAGTDAEATYQLGAIADLVAAVHAASVRVAVHSTRGRTPTSSPARPPSWPAGSGYAKRIRRRSLLHAFADTSWWRLLNDLLDVVDDG